MMRIVSHIEELLYVNDCVIVPGIGGFVLYTQHARYDQEKHMIKPEVKEVRFNERLTHDDGLLVQSYSNRYGVSYPVGKRMVEGDVEDLIKMLKTHHSCSLGPIGNLSINAYGHYEFEPSKTESFSPNTFGLTPLLLTPLSELRETITLPEVVNPKKNPNIIYIPLHLNILRGAAAVVAMIVMFFIMTTNVEEVDRSAYKAGFVLESAYCQALNSTPQPSYIDVPPLTTAKSFVDDKEVGEREVQVDSVKKDISVATRSRFELANLSESDEIKIEEIVEKENGELSKSAMNALPLKSEEIVPNQDSQNIKGPFYYIVIASLVSQTQAERYIREQKEFSPENLNVLEVNGKFRVYSERLTDKSSAIDQMNRLRKVKGFEATWIFTHQD